ncbi:MAG TPA: hypothetical protein PKM50_01735 [Methanoregula sp.]|nr:hypothetical protein [Methanoregula sp.]
MTKTDQNIPDFSDLTCTTLMIRLKMLLKKTPDGIPVECFVRRDQKDTVEVPFSRTGYDVSVTKEDSNQYRVYLIKKGAGPGS